MAKITFHQIGLFVESAEDLIKARLNKKTEIVLQQNKNQFGELIGYPFMYSLKGNTETNKNVDLVNDFWCGVFTVTTVDNINTIGGKINFLNGKSRKEATKIITSAIPKAVIIPKCEVLIR